MDIFAILALLSASGIGGYIGTSIKFLLEHKRAAKKALAETNNLDAQTDVQLDTARLAGVKALMEQLSYTQNLLKETRLECDLLREQNNMLRKILDDYNIPFPIEDRRRKKPKAEQE